MTIFNTNLVPTSKTISLFPLLAFTTVFLMLLNRVNSADSLSFSFNEFTAGDEDLILQGNATTGSGDNVLQLTKLDDDGNPERSSVGRVLYYDPVHLWKSSELVSSFETSFSFVISSSDPTPGDGLAFFITSPNTTIPHNSAGKYLGLFPGPCAIKDAAEAVVAVEFDTYPNLDIGDPDYKHIGIDINSVTSNQTTVWDWQDGKTATAEISYNSASQRLSVVASYPNSSAVTLHYDVDLFTILPEWVRVGFSASTGQETQANTLLSWSFSSSLKKSNKIEKEDMHLASIV